MPLVMNLKTSDSGLVLRTENTNRYYRDIRKYDTLTREEEVEWFTKLDNLKKKLNKAIEEDDKEACSLISAEITEVRNFIVNCNQRLCVTAAKLMANTDNLLDYVNEANIGLFIAVDRFDVKTGNKFCTYAMWYIRQAINQYLHNVEPMVYKTNNSKSWSIVSKAKNNFLQENERTPSEDELLDIVNSKLKEGTGIKDKADLVDIKFTMVDDYGFPDSTDTPSHNDLLEYNNASATQNDCEAFEEEEFNKELISSLLTVLKPREQKIIKMRFGLIEINGMTRSMTLTEIGKHFGLTSERVRQMEKDILAKLKAEYLKRRDMLFEL